ncbi:MAG: hypothetical protein CM1200mP12_05310 [Gammaproteobacteria bacterium]|nr:MAG: hypothetical protein CM1200mP12_05310 [Gammaproteobacteria bacterium]
MGKPEKLNSFLLELNKICERTGKNSEDLTVLGARRVKKSFDRTGFGWGNSTLWREFSSRS